MRQRGQIFTLDIAHLVKHKDLTLCLLCKTGQPGILWVKGPNVTDGYFNNPEETSRLIRDGWFCTEDMVSMDGVGFLVMRLSAYLSEDTF